MPDRCRRETAVKAMEGIYKMTRNLNVLGVALAALMAMSWLASTASAQFESEAESTNLTVSTNAMQKFAPTNGGGAIECTTIKATGTQSGKANTTVTISPTYSNCETFLGAATSVKTNGCQYVFHIAKGSTTGTTDIECSIKHDIGTIGGVTVFAETESTGVIEITVGSICKYTIGAQTGLGFVSFKNTGSGTTQEVIVEPNVLGIKSSLVTNDFFCPAAGSSGTYTGTLHLTAETAGGSHVGVFVD
ncbi:MAG: hypothetical protein ACJ76B_10985 [Solirubrobacterales bacterium]